MNPILLTLLTASAGPADLDEAAARLARIHVEAMHQMCGAELQVELDKASFAAEPESDDAIHSRCGAIVDAVARVCQDGHKELLQRSVKSLRCRVDKDGPLLVLNDDKSMVFTTTSTRVKRDEARALVESTLRDGDLSLQQSLRIKDQKKRFQELAVTPMAAECKLELAWEVDWEAFLPAIDEGAPVYAQCAAPLNRVSRACAWGKRAQVQKKIKRFQCAPAKKLKLTLKRGALKYGVDFGVKDPTAKIDRFLVSQKLLKKRDKMRDIKDPAALLRQDLSPEQVCRSRCASKCSGASNKSKCIGRCRRGC